MTADTDHFRELDRLFQEVCDLPADEREPRLRELAPDNPLLRQGVRDLLAAETGASTDLSPETVQVKLSEAFATGVRAPNEIAGYQIGERLGIGGMGVVYRAEQRSPNREVALKLLRPGIATPDLVRRFQFESEALGRLRHPGIAQVYEAGIASTDAGPQPFFAMELVHGRPLLAWASDRPTSERLAKVAEICDAVQHAHSRGVIHRDLKPGNIMVTEDGAAKVLDFGVAKATDADLDSQTLHTQAGQLVGTLPYMSPEQLSSDPREADTRSDVYALGVIMFEMLTGHTPHDTAGLGLLEAADVIRDHDAARLSTHDTRFRGDIDIIARKALLKDRDQRYQTAAELGDDIRRYLDGQTITARPASATYQLSRIAKRNKAMCAVVLVSSLLVAGLAVAASVAYTSERATSDRLVIENANFEAVNDFLRDMLVKANADETGGEIMLIDVLEAAADEVETGELNTREVDASLRVTLGATLGWLGYADRAVALLEPAVAHHREYYGELHERTIDALQMLVRFMAISNRPEDGLELLGDTPERYAAVIGDTALEQDRLVDLYRARAVSLKRAGRVEETEPVLREAARILETLRGPNGELENGALGEVYNELGSYHRMRNELADAEDYYRRSLEIYAQVHGEDTERYATVLNNLALVQGAVGRRAESLETLRRSVEISEAVYGDSAPGRIMVKRANLGNSIARLGRFAEAEPVLRKSLAEHIEVMPSDHPNLSFPMMYLADALYELGRYEEAASLAEEGIALMLSRFGPEHPFAVPFFTTLGWTRAAVGDIDGAVEAFESTTRAVSAAYGEDSDTMASTMLIIAAIYSRHGLAEEAAAICESVDVGASTGLRRTLDRTLGVLDVRDGDPAAALAHFDSWWPAMEAASEFPYNIDVHEAAEMYVELLLSEGRQDDAASCLRLLLTNARRSLGPDHAKLSRTKSRFPSLNERVLAEQGASGG